MEQRVKTKQMNVGPIRVPVMMKKQLAARLSEHLLHSGTSQYDETLERIILAGIEVTRRKAKHN